MSKVSVTLEPSDLIFLSYFNQNIDASADFKSSIIDFNSRERVSQFDKGNDFRLYLAKERFSVRYMEIFYPQVFRIKDCAEALSKFGATTVKAAEAVKLWVQVSGRGLRE